ncbi:MULTISPECIES: McrC family protein [unclassified Pseudomonas]|uniref:McrC family protein n=1 Tax=unclassified Pseudomonas TaxID=196821 RepID=UPI0004BAEAC9|nr:MULTISPECIES: hypothetical protein [unclassified Pseudomonas]
MKPLIQCEEWAKLELNKSSSLQSYGDFKSVLDSWKNNTGKEPSGYFDIRSEFLRPKFWSGTLDTPKFTLEVVPIGAMSLSQAKRDLLDSSLSEMLVASRSKQSIASSDTDLSSSNSRHDAMLEVFCNDLKLARRRQVLRRYKTITHASSSPKGRILFPGQCYNSIQTPGTILSQWVDFTEDVPENRIFKSVLLRYRPRCGSSSRSRIDQLLSELTTVNIAPPHLDWPLVKRDRLPEIYISLLSQSRLLLEDQAAGIFSGANRANSEIIFTSRLFEHYISLEIESIASNMGLKSKSQEHGNYVFNDTGSGSSFEMIPDLRIWDSTGNTYCIIDTKWKYLDHTRQDLDISRNDIYQTLIYGLKHNCKDVILLYPDVSQITGDIGYYERRTASLAGFLCNVHIAKVPMLGESMRASRMYLQKLLHKIKN